MRVHLITADLKAPMGLRFQPSITPLTPFCNALCSTGKPLRGCPSLFSSAPHCTLLLLLGSWPGYVPPCTSTWHFCPSAAAGPNKGSEAASSGAPLGSQLSMVVGPAAGPEYAVACACCKLQAAASETNAPPNVCSQQIITVS